jgi:hypothetical protein
MVINVGFKVKFPEILSAFEPIFGNFLQPSDLPFRDIALGLS